MRKLILFFIRKKLGIKKYECFRFKNQRKGNPDIYYIDDRKLIKMVNYDGCHLGACTHTFVESSVSLNYILSGKCVVEKLKCPCDFFVRD